MTCCQLQLHYRRRYKKKVEKDEDYIRQIKNLGDAVEQSIMQNYAIDIYQANRIDFVRHASMVGSPG